MKKSIAFTLGVLLLTAQPSFAEDVNVIFEKVNKLIAAGNYPKAMEELSWAKKEIEKKHFEKLGTLLKDDLAGFKGDKPKSQSVMGMSNVERTYTKGSERVKLTLTGGTGGAQGGLGGIAALARMGQMAGTQPGTETFRVDGRTATLTEKGKRVELSIFLDSGSMLKLDSRGGANAETLKKMVEELKIGELDSYLKGAS